MLSSSSALLAAVPAAQDESPCVCAAGCRVLFTPTVEHCSMATLIGLCIRTKLLRSLPPRFKVDILVSWQLYLRQAA